MLAQLAQGSLQEYDKAQGKRAVGAFCAAVREGLTPLRSSRALLGTNKGDCNDFSRTDSIHMSLVCPFCQRAGNEALAAGCVQAVDHVHDGTLQELQQGSMRCA